MSCWFGDVRSFQDCCGKFILLKELPATAEELMRSRYSAYATGAVAYIIETSHPTERAELDPQDIQDWLHEVTSWDRLHVISKCRGLKTDTTGMVEFSAHFHHLGKPTFIYEKSQFQKVNHLWTYLKT
jgi:SEC-C motif-containing protein